MTARLLIASAAIVLLASASSAQPSPPGAESPEAAATQLEARQLFVEGRELLARGQAAEACRLLSRSQQLVPAIGTLLNLGLCHRQNDQLATALENYQAAEALARAVGDAERLQLASQEALALEPRVGRLTLGVADIDHPGLEVRIDGAVEPRERWGLPIYLNAGEHWVEASVHGRAAWQTRLEIRNGQNRWVAVPVLGTELAMAPTVPTAKQAARGDGPTDDHTAQRVAAISLAAAGVVGVGLAVTFGVLAQARFSDSDPHCTSSDVCTDEGVELRQAASAHANRATVAVSIGAAALLAAAGLWWTLPDAPQQAELSAFDLTASPNELSLRLEGRF